MDEILQQLYDELRRHMLAFETLNKVINSITNENIINVRVKETLKNLSNNILSEQLHMSDYIFQLLDAVDYSEWDMIIEVFSGGEDG